MYGETEVEIMHFHLYKGRGGEMMDIRNYVKEQERDLMRWYRHLHQHPEPSFEEYETTNYIIAELEAMGYTTLRRVSKTGVVVDIEGTFPGNKVAIRADIDALFTEEKSQIEFPSLRSDMMHACGHDGHTTMLLGVAKYLIEHQQELSGSYRLLFQPGEEMLPGGALEYIEKGVLDGVDYIIGQHVMPAYPTGQFGLTTGAMMGSPDVFTIRITGKEGHASQPHLNVDVITTGAQIINVLQTIVSREIDALESVVISITNFHAGTAHNIMPRTAELVGTTRCLGGASRQYAHQRIVEIVESIAAMNRCTVDIEYVWGYDPTINDPHVAAHIKEVLKNSFGEESLPTIQPMMGGEDFGYYLNKVPGVFYFLGTGNVEKGYVQPLHHSAFQIDPPALLIGMEGMLRSALSLSTYNR